MQLFELITFCVLQDTLSADLVYSKLPLWISEFFNIRLRPNFMQAIIRINILEITVKNGSNSRYSNSTSSALLPYWKACRQRTQYDALFTLLGTRSHFLCRYELPEQRRPKVRLVSVCPHSRGHAPDFACYLYVIFSLLS
jgi:hypothetical protein